MEAKWGGPGFARAGTTTLDVRLLDVLSSTSLGPNADFSSQSTHLHALATDPHE